MEVVRARRAARGLVLQREAADRAISIRGGVWQRCRNRRSLATKAAALPVPVHAPLPLSLREVIANSLLLTSHLVLSVHLGVARAVGANANVLGRQLCPGACVHSEHFESARTVVQLPTGWGGCGYFSQERLRHAHLIGAWHMTHAPTRRRLAVLRELPTFSETDQSAFLGTLRTPLPQLELGDPRAWDVYSNADAFGVQPLPRHE